VGGAVCAKSTVTKLAKKPAAAAQDGTDGDTAKFKGVSLNPTVKLIVQGGDLSKVELGTWLQHRGNLNKQVSLATEPKAKELLTELQQRYATAFDNWAKTTGSRKSIQKTAGVVDGARAKKRRADALYEQAFTDLETVAIKNAETVDLLMERDTAASSSAAKPTEG
jgi:hypothetical protein